MKRLLFFAVLFTITLGSFSQESSNSKNKPNQVRSEYRLNIGSFTEKPESFMANEKYNWTLSNIENEADKVILNKMQESLAPFKAVISNELSSGNILTFSISFTSTLTYNELTEAMSKIKVKVTAKNLNKVEPKGGKSVEEIAK